VPEHRQDIEALKRSLPTAFMRALRGKAAASPVAMVEDIGALDMINDSKTAAVIWKRPIPTSVLNWFAELPLDRIEGARFVVARDDVRRCVEKIFGEVASVPGQDFDWLIGDITALSHEICRLFTASHVRVRVEVVSDDACRRFHMDAVRVRSICTYCGPGTEYGMSKGDESPEQVHHVPTGMPALFKGTKWPTSARGRLLHRSPPINGLGVSRLVVVIEPASDGSGERSPYDTLFEASPTSR